MSTQGSWVRVLVLLEWWTLFNIAVIERYRCLAASTFRDGDWNELLSDCSIQWSGDFFFHDADDSTFSFWRWENS